MKKSLLFTKIITLLLVAVLSFTSLIPLAPVRTEAAAVDEMISVPSSMVSVSKTHATFTKLSAISSVINLGIKGIGSFSYAAQNSDGSFGDFFNHAMAYFSGNVGENDQIADLKDSMNKQLDAISATLTDIQNELDDLKSSISSVSDEIKDNNEYYALQELLNSFYAYFYEKYTVLQTAYNVVNRDLDNPSVTDPSTNMDVLFAKAYDLNLLGGYVTGEISIEDTSIFDSYFEYELRKNGVSSADDDAYPTAVENTLAFAMKVFAAEVFQKYCLSYTLSYQLNWLNEHEAELIASGKDVEYTLSVTIPNDTADRNISRLEEDIYNAKLGLEKSMGAMAIFIARVCNLSSFVGYTQDGCEYYAPTTNGTLAVYPDAEYAFSTVADEFAPLFRDSFTFKTDTPSVLEIDRAGKARFIGTTAEPITVSYVYGTEDKETTVYSITLNTTEKLWQGGYGTTEAPYLISTATELKEYMNDTAYHSKHVKLIASISMKDQSVNSIPNLTGSIDGAGHTIVRLEGIDGGFILTNNGTVKNLTISSQVNRNGGIGSIITGGIAATNNGLIENCITGAGTVESSALNCDLDAASFKSSISATVGGIAGINNGTIRSCSAESVYIRGLTSTREYFCVQSDLSKGETWMYATVNIGGIAGINNEGGVIEDCYNVDTVPKSYCTSTYYKKTPWYASNTYYKVSTTVNHGMTIGVDHGTQSNNLYYALTEQEHQIVEDAFSIDGEYKSEIDANCATNSKNSGVDGTRLASVPERGEYVTSISVLSSPLRVCYEKGEQINTNGLIVVDNNGNEVLGFTASKPTMDSYGTKYVTITYGALSTEVPISVQCMHYGAVYSRATAPTCVANGYTDGMWCEDCDTYTDGHTTIPMSEIYCIDEDKDHACDRCTRDLGDCEDADDHLCDLCGAKISDCYDNNKDHLCDLCRERTSVCKDENSDHYCDICAGKLSSCSDGNDHLCDVCGEKISSCYDNDNHYCDVCGEKVSDHKDDDGSYYCDICNASLCEHEDESRDHLCDVCGTRMTECLDADDHLCDTCGEKISECSDTDDHECDLCKAVVSVCEDKDKNHLCDVCNAPLTVCGDENSDHKCDICSKGLTRCADEDSNHLCDICGAKVSSCTDADDHKCDVCNKKISDCTDTNDHLCDTCGATVSGCKDDNRNHACDICAKTVGTHEAAIGSHECGWCGKSVSACINANAAADHLCDVCGKRVNDCTDADCNHICDVCGIQASTCADGNADHKCDLCSIKLTSCMDNDSDHKCDVCKAALSECKDENSDHKCDLCGSILSECIDEDEDEICDVCRNEVKSGGSVALIVISSILGGGALIAGAWFGIRKLMGY